MLLQNQVHQSGMFSKSGIRSTELFTKLQYKENIINGVNIRMLNLQKF